MIDQLTTEFLVTTGIIEALGGIAVFMMVLAVERWANV